MVSFSLLIAVYALTACRTVGPGDSGELVVAMSRWGVPHAPGFPLLCLIGNLVSRLPLPGEPALILNLLTSVFAALACAALASAVTMASRRPWAGFVAALALGTSRPFWRNVLVTEVFALNALMAALLLVCLVMFERGLRDRRPVWWALPVSAAVLSTALTHHMTLVLLGAPVVLVYGYLLFSYLRRGGDRAPLVRASILSVAFGAAGLLVLLYIPIAAHFEPPLSWGDARDLPGMIQLLTRKDFGSGTLMAPAIAVTALLEHGESVNPLPPRHWLVFWADIPHSFGWLFPVLALAGLFWAARRARALLLLAVGFLAMLWLFFLRVNTPLLPLYLGITERMYVLPHLVIAFYAGLGVAQFMQLMQWSERVHRRAAPAVGLAATLGTGVPMLAVHWSAVDMHANTFTRDFGTNLMAGLPPRTVVLSSGDLFRNSLAYAQHCLRLRPDLTVVDQSLLMQSWYRNQCVRRLMLDGSGLPIGSGPQIPLDSRTMLSLVSRPIRGRQPPGVVTLKLPDDGYKATHRLLPVGIWSRVVPRGSPVGLEAWAGASTAVARDWDLRSLGPDYAETGWERSEEVFYTLGIARTRGVRDLLQLLEPPATSPPKDPVPRFETRWGQEHQADLLAYESDFLCTCVTDSLLSEAYRNDARVPAKAMALARASLEIEPGNVTALQARDALMAAVPALADPRQEVLLRARIVEQRPGDLAELVPFLRLVLRRNGDPATRDAALDRAAREAQSRFLRILALATKVSDDSQLSQLYRDWSLPLESVPELQ
jgi:hypothetical protein